jgi:mono/diheme cytochrome c family protein
VTCVAPPLALIVIATTTLAELRQPDKPPPVDYARDVRPILAKHCYSCHGPDEQKSGLRLDRRADALAGGDRGSAIEPGQSEDSRLIQYVTGMNDDEIIMPPEDERLSEAQIKLLRRWIDEGAKWPEDRQLLQRCRKRAERAFIEQDEPHQRWFAVLVQEVNRRVERHAAGLIDGVRVHAGAERRKGNGLTIGVDGELQCAAIGARQMRRFARLTAAPDGSDSMDHIPGSQLAAA